MRRLFAVLGEQVQTSLSPRLHAAAARAMDIDLAYVPVVCRDEAHFRRAVGALAELGAAGANVTMPYKQAALALCVEVTEAARAIGAVNTLTFSADGLLSGANTDGPALVRLFACLPPDRLARVQILGAGGAARSVAWALAEVGAAEVHVAARRHAEDVATRFGARGGPLTQVEAATLVVSTLPGEPEVARTALREWVDRSGRPHIYDLAYGTAERPSALVTEARAEGLTAADGRGMLVEQAALALSRWTGQPVEPLRRAMKVELRLPPGDDPFDSNPGAD